MAKLDDLDPRWIVNDRMDGRNVNDWHWSEKDVTADARRRFVRWVSSRVVHEDAGGDVAVRLLAVRGEVEGESTALNRRGKQGVFFDFDATVEWQAEAKDPYGYRSCDASGTLSFNVDQQTVDSFPVEVSVETPQMSGTAGLLALVRGDGVAALRTLVARFYAELRAAYDPRAAAERAAEEAAARRQAAEVEAAMDAKRLEEEEAFLAEQEKKSEAAPLVVAAAEAVPAAGVQEGEATATATGKPTELEGVAAAASVAAPVRAAAAEAAVVPPQKPQRPRAEPVVERKKCARSEDELLSFICGSDED